MSIREQVECRIFGYNKAIGKREEEPRFVDQEAEVAAAMQRLEDRLVELALEGADFDF